MPRSSRANRLPGVTSNLRPLPTVPAYIDSALVGARSAMDDAAAIQQMASDMQEHGTREGGLTRDGLALLGFTDHQIDRLAARARTIAQRAAGATL